MFCNKLGVPVVLLLTISSIIIILVIFANRVDDVVVIIGDDVDVDDAVVGVAVVFPLKLALTRVVVVRSLSRR